MDECHLQMRDEGGPDKSVAVGQSETQQTRWTFGGRDQPVFVTEELFKVGEM